MSHFNNISLLEFIHALEFTDRLFDGPSAEQIPLLSQINENCRLAASISSAMMEFENTNSVNVHKEAFKHYRVIISLWILLYEPDILAQLKH